MKTILAFAVAIVAAMWIVPTARAAEISSDIARGEHVATAMTHCSGCHGVDLGGERSFPAGPGGKRVYAGNLTSGTGGVGIAYSDADYVRAIREGRRPNGAPLAVMPWPDFAVLTDRDVDSLVAYIRSLPPVDRSDPSDSSEPRAVVSPGTQLPGTQPPGTQPPRAQSAEAVATFPPPGTPGVYLARLGGCLTCHGADLHGRTLRGSVAPDISRGGIGSWTAAQFTAAMRTGRTPEGSTLREPMPWRAIGGLSDAELSELYRFIESEPARAAPASN